ncbi:hypothetical protein EBS02_12115, partial [bacterium]|nr:hypothetical protein [bacterium]
MARNKRTYNADEASRLTQQLLDTPQDERPNSAIVERLIELNSGLIYKRAKYYFGSISPEEAMQLARIGAALGIRDYGISKGKGYKLSTFIGNRVTWEIQRAIKDNKSGKNIIRKINQKHERFIRLTYQKLKEKLGREPTFDEVFWVTNKRLKKQKKSISLRAIKNALRNLDQPVSLSLLTQEYISTTRSVVMNRPLLKENVRLANTLAGRNEDVFAGA